MKLRMTGLCGLFVIVSMGCSKSPTTPLMQTDETKKLSPLPSPTSASAKEKTLPENCRPFYRKVTPIQDKPVTLSEVNRLLGTEPKLLSAKEEEFNTYKDSDPHSEYQHQYQWQDTQSHSKVVGAFASNGEGYLLTVSFNP